MTVSVWMIYFHIFHPQISILSNMNIFCCGFFPAALAALACLLGGLALLWHDGLYAMPPWLDDFVGYLWLVMFPEAFINGMLVTGLVVFYPDWLETFNRTRYLSAPWKDGGPDGPP